MSETPDLRLLWRGAVTATRIKHIDPTCEPSMVVLGEFDAPELFVSVKNCRNTCDQEVRFPELAISTVRLRIWPGRRLAAAWLAAAWAGYIMHEALELVTDLDNRRPLDPHDPPHLYDKGLRHGYPVELTLETLERTLCLVMDPHVARSLIESEVA